ncbi:MAG: PEGA domain-containing protein [Deltaproteobacteria bacterium]|nr:PEGA domain-containing protein [Deltaproteobacteria bacterium]
MRLHRTALALCLALGPATALAQQQQPPPAAIAEARERYQRGIDLFEERNYDAAMAEFQRAYELTRNPAVLFNISATHELTGHFVEALDAMLDYERRAPAAAVQQRRADVDAALGRLRSRIGTIVIRFEAAGLDVRVDGLQRPRSSGNIELRVAAGRHRVSLSAPHYQAREAEFDVAGGSTIVISEPLTPERAFMAVECNVPGAEVLVDGRPIATTPVTSPLPVPEGSHHVVVRRAGYTTYETDVNSVGAGARVRADLAWADPMPRDVGARVTVQANEPDIVAMIDGRRVASDGTALVPPGRHTLRVERADFLPDEREVDLAPGRDNALSVFLLPTPAYREAYSSGRRRALVTGGVVLGVGVAVLGGGAALFFINEGTLGDAIASRDANQSELTACARMAVCSSTRSPVQVEQARNDASVDVDNATTLRWASVGIMGAGLITSIVGTVLLAGAPSGSRFERHAALVPRVGFTARNLQLAWSF